MSSRARIDEFGLSAGQVRKLPQFALQTVDLYRRMAHLRALVRQIRDQKRQDLSSKAKGINWFELLDQAGFSLRSLTNELNHIYGAFNAIDYSLTCALYELGHHPEWADDLAADRTTDLAA